MQLLNGLTTSVRNNAQTVIAEIQLSFQRLHSVLQARYANSHLHLALHLITVR